MRWHSHVPASRALLVATLLANGSALAFERPACPAKHSAMSLADRVNELSEGVWLGNRRRQRQQLVLGAQSDADIGGWYRG